jgi:pimeloyl-ACP methyl ester carboxylesterase
MGVYQAVFTTIDQTEPLTQNKIRVPVVALGGEKTLGENVHRNVEMVAENLEGGTVTECGHFVPEERPDEIVGYVLALTNRTNE